MSLLNKTSAKFSSYPHIFKNMTFFRTLIPSLALVLSSTANAEWKLLDRTPDSKVFFYYETNSVKKNGKTINVYQLDDFAEIQVRGQYSFHSIVKQMKFDCRKEVYSIINMTIYAGRFGEGSPLKSAAAQQDSWLPILPQTAGEIVKKTICK